LVDEAKLLTAGEGNGDQVVRIEGGLPELPGTNIIMPELNPSPVIESKAEILSPPNHEPVEPAE
jgi:hypothetical protein